MKLSNKEIKVVIDSLKSLSSRDSLTHEEIQLLTKLEDSLKI